MKNAISIVTFSVALSAGLLVSPTAISAPIVVATESADSNAAQMSAEDPVPSVRLTDELLFDLMKAEIAYQRNDWQTAYITTFSAALQTYDPRLARRAEEIALNAKHVKEALAAIRLWRTLAPHSDEAAQHLLGLAVLTDDFTEVRPLLQQRLADAPPQTRDLLILQTQRLLARAKDKEGAFSLLKQLLAPYEALPETHVALAQGAFVKGDRALAHTEASVAVAAHPDSELAAITYAQVEPDKANATKSLASFLSTHSNAREVRISYARLLWEQKQYDKAAKEFEFLLQTDPQNLALLYALGTLNVQNDDLKKSEKYFAAYMDAFSANPNQEADPIQVLVILVQIAEQRKDTPAALKWLSRIPPGPAYFSAQLKRAQLIAKNGDLPAARKLLADLDTDDEREQQQVLLTEAQILRDANQTQQAFSLLQSATQRFAKNTDLLYDYAMTAEKLDKLDVMEAALRKIITLAPDSQQAYNALGYALADRNVRLQEAVELIDKALKLAPEDAFITDSMGWVEFRLGHLAEAESLLRHAYENQADAEIAVHLGEVLWAQGQKEEAQKFWREAKAKDPKNDTLKSTLNRLNVKL